MTLSITHTTQSAVVDELEPGIIGPDEWNASHTITGLGVGVQTFLETPSSANLAAAVMDETGSGALVFGTAPTITVTATGGTTARTLQTHFADQLYVEDFGAVGDGTTDDTAAIQDAIDAAITAGGAVVNFGPNVYKFTSTLTINGNNVTLRGQGKVATRLLFAPTADDIAIDISNGANIVHFTKILSLSLYSSDTTYTKTAISASDVDFFELDDVLIYGADAGVAGTATWGGGTGSIGVRTYGRDFIQIKDTCDIQADKPVVLSANPNSFLDFDHSYLYAYLVADGSPCITADDGVFMSNARFGGAWAGGTHGFYYNDTTSTAANNNVRFEHLRTEQGTDTTAYSIYFASTAHSCNGFSIDDANLDSGRRGIFLTKVTFASVKDTIYTDTTKEALNVDNTVNHLVITNCYWQTGSTASIIGLNTVYKGPVVPSGGSIPGNAYYSTSTANLTVETLTANTKIVPDADDGATIGQSGTAFSDLFLASGGQINWNSSTLTAAESAGSLVVTTGADNAGINITNTNAGVNGASLTLFADSASPAGNDVVSLVQFRGRDGAANNQLYGYFQCIAQVVTDGAESGQFNIGVTSAGSNKLLSVDGASSAFYPNTTTFSLGAAAASAVWSGLYLASNSAIDFGVGDVTITHSANALAFAGATSGYSFDDDLLLPSAGVINWNAGTLTLTQSSATLTIAGASASGTVLKIQNTDDGTTGANITFYHNSASPAVSDNIARIDFTAKDSAGNDTTYASFRAQISDPTNTTETGLLLWSVSSAGTNTLNMALTGSALRPNTNDQIALGTATVSWSDLFLASGGVINFNNGDVTLTHSANTLAFAGASTGYTFDGPLTNTSTAAILTGTAIPAGGTAGSGYKFSSTSNFGMFFGSGAPTLSAAKGSIYLRSDGSSGSTRMYVNTDGATTWTNVTTAA